MHNNLHIVLHLFIDLCILAKDFLLSPYQEGILSGHFSSVSF